MDISLDDYIAQKSLINNNENQKQEVSHNIFERRKVADEDDDDISIVNENTTLWKAPSSNLDFLEFNKSVLSNTDYDLRDKIIDSSSSLPNEYATNSPNWRLHQLNNFSPRPSGMPPLVPLKTPMQSLMDIKVNNNVYNNHKRRRNRNRNRVGSNNNWRMNRYQNNQNGKTLKQAMQHLELNSQSLEPIVNIKVPFKNNEKLVPRNVPLATAATSTVTSGAANSNNIFTRCLMPNFLNDTTNAKSYGNNGATMPQLLAAQMLESINASISNTIHKPIYDMEVHKEIHKLQGKRFLYECGNGGSLISGDGPGLGNVKIKPAATQTSLNCRFS